MNETEKTRLKKRLKEVTEREFSIEDFIEFENTLISWNERINLVSKNTIPDMHERHFLDSAQIYPFITGKELINKNAISIADMGAGAGFPSIVLAILIKNSPELKHINICIDAIESIKKKADFLNYIVQTLDLKVIIRNQRIENITDKKYDIITARALKGMNELFKYAHKISYKHTTLIFLKGEKAQEELLDAKKYWTFKERLIPSKTSDSGHIVIVKNLQALNPNTRKKHEHRL